MDNLTKPVYLLADSMPLFNKDSNGEFFLADITKNISSAKPKAAYIGASNGDNPEFYNLFVEAMKNIGVEDCKMIISSFGQTDKDYLSNADIILLAGGDVKSGWEIINSSGMKDIITRRYNEGATLVGISAGARHLSWQSLGKDDDEIEHLFDTLKIAPFIVVTGDDSNELKTVIELSETMKKGFIIPFGGMLVYYPDQTVLASRKAVDEMIFSEGSLKESIVLPGDDQSKNIDSN